jgi:hypothetical protein
VTLHQGSGATSRKWRHIREVVLYKGGDVITRSFHPTDETRPIVDCTPPRPARLFISTAPHHSLTLSATSAVLKLADGPRNSRLNTRWVGAADSYLSNWTAVSNVSVVAPIIL